LIDDRPFRQRQFHDHLLLVPIARDDPNGEVDLCDAEWRSTIDLIRDDATKVVLGRKGKCEPLPVDLIPGKTNDYAGPHRAPERMSRGRGDLPRIVAPLALKKHFSDLTRAAFDHDAILRNVQECFTAATTQNPPDEFGQRRE
jgi:hypothetical protein